MSCSAMIISSARDFGSQRIAIGGAAVDDLNALGDKDRIQSALRGDLELITRYGEEHPETWAGVWFDNEPTVRVVAAFTGDLARHDAALRPLLRYPDRFVVESGQHSLAGLQQVRKEIRSLLDQRAEETGRWVVHSVGIRTRAVHVRLRADQEDLADELAARYGDAVQLQVGAFSFPDRQRGRPRRPAPTLQEQVFDGLEVSVEADRSVLEVGDDGRAQFVLRNSGPERIGPLHTGRPLVGTLLDGSHETVGVHVGAIAGTGLSLSLAPGESASISVLYGTASIREDLGYLLPPGTYWLKVQMTFKPDRRLGLPTHALTAPLVQVTIVPRPHLQPGNDAGG